ncbi:hypothetical protein KXD96_27290 [Mycobacterium sp. SMC-2]|uniref:hypothetical protein n=1 Tax=Mycobacterium TaxID=1763 RepID=UPI001CE07BF6|nr:MULTISPECIES: hypothetical protein [Mycobacterium]MCA4761178.1 hypothetical protein [Mycobacterium avium subsp. hominissuis]UXA06489.1 hypothetical protein KXD96_27290 [Mycobacterium sp. SMC-2]
MLVALLPSMYVAIDQRQVSYIQGDDEPGVSEEAARAMIEKASESGIPISQRGV